MRDPYKALYEARLHFDPFSFRKAIDCRTPLEDIFAAFLGETVIAATDGFTGWQNWEVSFIYFPSIKCSRDATERGKDYAPTMVLSQDELDALLGRPLGSWYPNPNPNLNPNGRRDYRYEMSIARTITKRFCDITLSYDGLTKLTRKMLDPKNEWIGNPLKRADCHLNAPDSIVAIEEMINAIVAVRNPSSHRGIQTTDVSMKTICANARIACSKIANALPLMKDVFYLFTDAAAQDLQDRYCALITRVLDDLDKKLSEEAISFDADKVSYRDISGYNIFLDESALSTGHTATLGKLVDEMDVFVYEDSITSLAKVTTNPDALTRFIAKRAMSTFHLYKNNIKVLNNLAENDRKSILQALCADPDKKFFVITESRSFAQQILELGNPLHIAARILNDRGEFTIYRSETPDE